ncbi:hypothetical protein SteCoe_18457 [Stentor coeruleus]|uniref:GAR domain-containing protein n=1 Tax=Stentor coeruleus TaxID=5963 RepID=A0A1R2BWE1_9CILI|nr:hypothetical protein SteCoe_18457 [Stentor coeruleus]
MWKEIIETKVIRAEGIDLNNLISLIYVTDILAEELTPYNIEKSFELPLKSTCRIVLKSVLTGESLSVSFNTKIFDEDGVQWLPLYRNQQSDYLESIPDEVISPRVLMLLHKKNSFDIIIEGGEKSEVGSECEDDYMPEIKLCRSFIENLPISPFDDIDEHQGQEATEVNSPPRFSIGIADEINQELRNNLERLMKTLEIEKKSKESISKEMENMKNCFLIELSEAKKRENELLDEFKDAETRFSASKFEMIRLKHEIKSVQAENTRLQQALHQSEMSQISRIEEMSKKLAIYEDNQSETDSILTKLSELTGHNFDNHSEKLKEKDEIIKKLNREITELKLKAPMIPHMKNTVPTDELDEAVNKYSMKIKLNGPIVKDKEQIYVYNGKKINLLLKEGQLLCRVGGIFKPFEECINGGVIVEPPLYKSVKNSFEVVRENEDTNKTRTSTGRISNKSLTISSRQSKRKSPFN